LAGSELSATMILMLIGMIVVAALAASIIGANNIMTYYLFVALGGVYLVLVLLTYILWYRFASS